jgi:hypothetical protein
MAMFFLLSIRAMWSQATDELRLIQAPLARRSKDPGLREKRTPPRATHIPLSSPRKAAGLQEIEEAPSPPPEMRPVSSGGSVSQPGTPPLSSGHRAVVTPPDGARRSVDAGVLLPASPFEASDLQSDDAWRISAKHRRTVSSSIPAEANKREIRTSASGSGSFGSLRWSRSRSVGRTRVERLASADAPPSIDSPDELIEECGSGTRGSGSPRELSEAIQARLKTLLSAPASSLK